MILSDSMLDHHESGAPRLMFSFPPEPEIQGAKSFRASGCRNMTSLESLHPFKIGPVPACSPEACLLHLFTKIIVRLDDELSALLALLGPKRFRAAGLFRGQRAWTLHGPRSGPIGEAQTEP